jgi:hypothetical protein
LESVIAVLKSAAVSLMTVSPPHQQTLDHHHQSPITLRRSPTADHHQSMIDVNGGPVDRLSDRPIDLSPSSSQSQPISSTHLQSPHVSSALPVETSTPITTTPSSKTAAAADRLNKVNSIIRRTMLENDFND